MATLTSNQIVAAAVALLGLASLFVGFIFGLIMPGLHYYTWGILALGSVDRKVLVTFRLLLNPEKASSLHISSVGLLPLLLLAAGGYVWWRSKMRSTFFSKRFNPLSNIHRSRNREESRQMAHTPRAKILVRLNGDR